MASGAVLRIGGGHEVPIDTPDATTLLERVEAKIAAGESFAVATINLDHVVKLQRDPGFRAAYAAQTFVVADGNPIVWTCKLAGTPVSLTPGSELVEPLCALAARMGVPVGLLGSTQEVLDQAAETLELRHPGLKVVARISPPFGFEPESAQADACLDALAASGARLCLLALGAPKQERLAARGVARVPATGFVSVGAGVDFIAGAQVRAPAWVRRIAMEWLWRMLSNPGRLAKRYAQCAAVLPGLFLRAAAAKKG
ncbi:WecB/TagA/CpsF family glycosyltransferase [Rhodovulum sp. DZ06]|uniref:WecB/TagA/CpsF family glycosyltransferase n=1 Tax=Rhodovulum sp. DZ06 TaxID=3425126 RepID=UPI003D35795F